MRSFQLLKGILVFCSLLAPTLAHAIPCSSALIINLLGTTCTIGDKTFTFNNTTDNSQNTVLESAGDFRLSPDSSAPLAPSFRISAVEGLTLPPSGFASYSLFFTVSTTNGSATLAGVDVTVRGIVNGGTVVGGAGGGTVVDAANESTSNTITPPVFPEACIQSGGGFSKCVPTEGSGSASGIGTFVGGPISTENGIADWELFTDSTGTASFTSATYSFDQVSAEVLEPASLTLLGVALAGMRLARRRR